MTKKKKALNVLVFILVISAVLTTSFFLTKYVANDADSQQVIQSFGYLGIILISFLAGLNAFVPIPAASFVPVFTAAGISLPIIIIHLVVGTMAANYVSYYVGRYGGKITSVHYPKAQQRITELYEKHKQWLPYFVFGFAAFVPMPDEIYLIPLGIIGIELKHIIIPLFLGTICYQTLLTLGIDNIFTYLLPLI